MENDLIAKDLFCTINYRLLAYHSKICRAGDMPPPFSKRFVFTENQYKITAIPTGGSMLPPYNFFFNTLRNDNLQKQGNNYDKDKLFSGSAAAFCAD